MPSSTDPRAELLKSRLNGLIVFLRDRGLSFQDIPIALVALVLIHRLDAFQRANRHTHLYERTISSTKSREGEPRSLDVMLAQSELPAALTAFVSRFSEGVRETLTLLGYDRIVRTLSGDDLRDVLRRLTALDLSPDTLSDRVLSDAVDDLIARFGEEMHFAQFHTPRDVAGLMAELLVAGEERRARVGSGETRITDRCCGTGGLLIAAVGAIERGAAVREVVGHDVAAIPVGLTRARLLLRYPDRQAYAAITQSDSLMATDHGPYDYIVANPPFGWIAPRDADDQLRPPGRERDLGTRALRHRVNSDLLFLENAVTKMRPKDDGGARAVVITSASALFAAGAREVAIRRALLEGDFVEAVVELPSRVFATTAITTFVWVLSNRKPERRCGNSCSSMPARIAAPIVVPHEKRFSWMPCMWRTSFAPWPQGMVPMPASQPQRRFLRSPTARSPYHGHMQSASL